MLTSILHTGDLLQSAERIALPTFDGDALSDLIQKLVMMDSHWIPSEAGHSLYIRPTLIGTQNALGVGPAADALLFVICCPVGPYYPSTSRCAQARPRSVTTDSCLDICLYQPALSPSRCSRRRTTPGPALEAPAASSSAPTTPPASCLRSRPPRRATRRTSGSLARITS
jgi:hypothetical protein